MRLTKTRTSETDTLDHRLSQLAGRDPDRSAVVVGERRMTLRELDERVEALARRIRVVADPGTRVAVLLGRGADTVAAPYAVWRAGCVYVPLDVAWPRVRIDDMLRRAEIGVLIEDGDEELAVTPRAAAAPAGPTAVAYIIHTSGSSGRPKGVQVTHQSMNALVDNHQRMIYLPEGVTEGPVAMLASAAFDSSIERLALVPQGYTVHILGDEVKLSPDRLVGYLAEHRIVNADFVPSHLRVLVDAGLFERATALRLLIVGGERFDATLWQTVARSGVTAYNVYGPTENTVNTSIAKVRPNQLPNIGHPLPGVSCAIVTEGRAVTAGEPGELIVGGVQLSLGYLGDDALTAHAFRDFDGARCYWTGDLVRVVDDTGALEFLGRVDDQVKINGYRTEPGEIAHHLRQLPGVSDAAVTPIDSPAGPRLLASVVLDDAEPFLDSDGLRAALADRLPPYMIPACWMALPELPLTTNLKRDHDALRALWRSRTEPTSATTVSAQPTNPPDVVRQAFRDVLGSDVVDDKAHFFATGGDSVGAMKLIVQVRNLTGIELKLVDIVKNPTVEKLTELLSIRGSGG